VRIRIHYWARQAVPRGSVVFYVSTREQAPLILTSTQPDRKIPCRIDPGPSYADCVFPCWPLASGRYVVGAGLAVPGLHFIWRNDHLCELVVEDNDIFHTGLPPSSDRYLIAVEHDWELAAAG
jgi:hypothetical protein